MLDAPFPRLPPSATAYRPLGGLAYLTNFCLRTLASGTQNRRTDPSSVNSPYSVSVKVSPWKASDGLRLHATRLQ